METIISIIFSGVVGSFITVIFTSVQQKKANIREYKMQIFKEIVSYRTDIVNENHSPTGNFQNAINQVFIAYNDCNKVLVAYDEFRKSVTYKSNNDEIINNLIILLKAMANDLKIDYSFTNDDLFTKPIMINK